jgi:hypothetical protein
VSVSSSEEAAGPAAPAGPAIVQGEEARARAAIQARANVVIGYALELAEAVDELQAYRSLLTALNSSPIELAQPHVRALAVVRAGAWRSAIWLVCALLEPLGRERSNLGQVFHMLKDQAVADDLTAPDSKRHKLPDRRKLDEAITRHAQLVGSKRYANVRHLRNSMAHLLSGKLVQRFHGTTPNHAGTVIL